MRTVLAIAGLLMLSQGALAACVCRCVDGEMQPLCSSTLDISPICPPAICPMTPPSIAPPHAPSMPPVGTARCGQRQVQNPDTGRYQWRQICE